MIEFVDQRRPTVRDTTFGDVRLFGVHECYTLEDAVREIDGIPVAEWKVKGKTAIPAGSYRITLEDSPRFGPDTITLHGVEGFDYIRIHGGNDDDDTEGCPLVGDKIIEDPDGDGGDIAGGSSRPALNRLKTKIKGYLAAGEECYWTVRNPA